MRYDADNDWVVIKPNPASKTYRVWQGKKLGGGFTSIVVFKNWDRGACEKEAKRMNKELQSKKRREKPVQPPLFEEVP